jgi:pSer/pThr/pTyr-binding forkhead associated (FHA) protein
MVSRNGQLLSSSAGKAFALTGHVPAGGMPLPAQPAPQTSGFIAGPATLVGSAGSYPVLDGVEMRVGRDGTSCTIVLQEPRVSSNHASIRRENGVIAVRDDHSHNGTFVNGSRIQSGVWTALSLGSSVRFGPAEFTLRGGN